ncbi:MAG: CRISPR-associated protein Cas4 [bacterium]|nr:CRISPR-associated protein Cas4 [bacterium]
MDNLNYNNINNLNNDNLSNDSLDSITAEILHKIDIDINSLYITGLQVAYYKHCKRKAYLFSKKIQFEHTSEFIELGKLLEQKYFKEEESLDSFDKPVKIDFYTIDNEVIIHEIKRSDKTEESHIYQVKYYIWYLKNKGINCNKGIIHYPRLAKKIEITLENNDYLEIPNILLEIDKLIRSNDVPKPIRISICNNCSYFYYCYV